MNSEKFYRTYLQHPQIFTDSRKVTSGCLYFALKGEHFDGNRFAADALKNGCAFAIVDDEAMAVDDRYILVPDVLVFLQELAVYHRNKLDIPVIGLTGTNGKTTTKELINSVLSQKFRTVATGGNLNNHIGVPVTLLRADQDTEVLIVEMGANHPGEIAFLCSLAKPTHGLITNVGKAHLEGFGNFEGVIRTKNELFDWIKGSHGELFVNEDDPLVRDLAGNYPAHTYGTKENANLRGTPGSQPRLMSVDWNTGAGNSHSVNSHLSGGYNLYNILAAISVGVQFGLDPDSIAKGIASYVPENMRSQWLNTGRNELFLDAYNANPSSMELAIKHFAGLNFPLSVVILGDMFELGQYSEAEHLNIIRQADQSGFEKILFAGPRFYRFAGDFPHHFFENLNSLIEYLSSNQLSGCNIMIKGSRGMQLERLVPYL